MVLTAYSALSPVTGLSCHRRLADTSATLDASVGASGPHDFAVRISVVRPRKVFALRRCRVHRIPRPTSVTIAIRPSCGCGITMDVEVIWVRSEPEYFCKRGWTGMSVICPTGQRNQRSGTFARSRSRSSNAAGNPGTNYGGRILCRGRPASQGLIPMRHSRGEQAECAGPEVTGARASSPKR